MAKSQGFSMDDYVDVAARLVELREKHPEASLQPVDPRKPFEVVEVGGKLFIAYSAACYREPGDKRPGIGVAWEPFPGPTKFTEDSELQNAETSAWGRAIVAALAADTKRGVSSAQEVRNRQGNGNGNGNGHGPVTDKQRLVALCQAEGIPATKANMELVAAKVAGTGDDADSSTPEAGTDGEGGGSSQAPAESASSSPLPASDEEKELASRPCELCGSKRAGRTVVGGKVRCQNATECEKRAQEPM